MRDLPDLLAAYTCWRDSMSTGIIHYSSLKLNRDVVKDFLIQTIPSGNEKLINRYSILVKEHAESAASFEFNELLKKNTELTGSIFSSQPSALQSNLHQTNGQKVVIGQVDLASESSQRIFIDFLQIRAWPSG